MSGEEDVRTCVGEWLTGSGGHRNHGPYCGKPATWYHEDDMWPYCDEHCPEMDKVGKFALIHHTN
jgi:hypothetical protein